MDDDRISQLPECIGHHILSFLVYFPIELVRMSVLSKHWFALTASFPILCFDIHKFTKAIHASSALVELDEDSAHVKNIFFKYVDYTMSRFLQQQNVNVRVFQLITSIKGTKDSDTVDRWLGSVLKKGGMRELVFEVHSKRRRKYRLPNILLSVSSLIALRIHNCELPSSLMVDAFKFKSLRLLSLNWVALDDEIITRLSTSCPVLYELYIRFCYGFKRLCVYGHQNLRRLEMYCFSEVERIHIEAPNLGLLFFVDLDGRGAPCMNLASCKNLLSVSYLGNPFLISEGSTDFLSIFPFVKDLWLTTYGQCNNLKLSSHSLRTLWLRSSYGLELIELNTPNLTFLNYSSDLPAPYLPVRDSKAQMVCNLTNGVDTLWLQKLRQFLNKKNGFTALKLDIHALSTQNFVNSDELKAIHMPPYELEHVTLELDFSQESSVLVAVVDAVLWCCCPRVLTLWTRFSCFDFKERSDVVKFTYEKLLQQGPGETYIQIELSSSSKDKMHFNDLNSLLTALPHDRVGKLITFIKGRR